jgi:hypothetical protein
VLHCGVGGDSVPGTTPQQSARQDDSVQSIAGRDGQQDNWQQIANNNDIDNPRNVPAGTPVSTR